jgi:hypothetical protein
MFLVLVTVVGVPMAIWAAVTRPASWQARDRIFVALYGIGLTLAWLIFLIVVRPNAALFVVSFLAVSFLSFVVAVTFQSIVAHEGHGLSVTFKSTYVSQLLALYRDKFHFIVPYWELARSLFSVFHQYALLLKVDIRMSRFSIEDLACKRAMAQMVIAWENIEVLLDYINATILMRTSKDDSKLPIFVNRKLDLLLKSVTTIDALAPLKKNSLALVTDIYALKVVRHDIAHRMILKTIDSRLAQREIIGQAAEFVPYAKNYTSKDIVGATERILNLTENLIDLLSAIDVILKDMPANCIDAAEGRDAEAVVKMAGSHSHMAIAGLHSPNR